MGFPRQKSLSLLRQPHIPTARPCRLPVLLCQVLLPGEAHLPGAAAGRAVPAARCSARRGEPAAGTAGVMNQSLAEGSAEPPRQPGYGTITALLLSLWLLVPFSVLGSAKPGSAKPGSAQPRPLPANAPRLPRGGGDVTSAASPRARPAALPAPSPGPKVWRWAGRGRRGGAGVGRGREPLRQHGQRRARSPSPRRGCPRNERPPGGCRCRLHSGFGGRAESAAAGAVAAAGAE